MANPSDVYREDIAEIKSLIRGSRWAGLNQSPTETGNIGVNGVFTSDPGQSPNGLYPESGMGSQRYSSCAFICTISNGEASY